MNNLSYKKILRKRFRKFLQEEYARKIILGIYNRKSAEESFKKVRNGMTTGNQIYRMRRYERGEKE